MEIVHHDKIEFDYVNWKGVKGRRKVEVNEFHYDSTKYHPEKQWLLEAFDLDKGELRIFAMRDMSNVKILDK
jgi:predicted DNA-binding transcriptional regulator YafY